MGYQNNGGRPWGPEQWEQTMRYQNNGGRPWGSRTMGADHGVPGADHEAPEQWGRPWGTRTMGVDHGVPEQWGQTMGYQNNGSRP